jgi:hypothetical protein
MQGLDGIQARISSSGFNGMYSGEEGSQCYIKDDTLWVCVRLLSELMKLLRYAIVESITALLQHVHILTSGGQAVVFACLHLYV